MEEEKIDTSTPEENEAMNVVNSIFIGKTKNIVIHGEEGNKKENISSGEFKTIYLDASEKDLYRSWELQNENIIQDYKDDKGNPGPALKKEYITELPKVLLIMIKRLRYDSKNNIFKSNEPFEFDDVMYPDRHMLENRKEVESLRKEVDVLREKANKLNQHIQQFKDYNGNKQELSNVLNSTAHLLKANVESMDSDINQVDGIELFSPKNLCKAVEPSPNDEMLNKMITYLTALQEKTNDQVTAMETKYNELQEEIKGHYKSIDKTSYHLQSILIHDGNHESGHFYTFIKDFAKGIYRRYNDHNVSEVTEERVKEESIGGLGNISAYCLIYVNEEIYQTCCNPKLQKYELQYRDKTEQDEYNKLVPAELAELVYIENDELVKTIEEAEASEKAKEIMDLYDERMQKLSKFMEEFKGKSNLLFVSSIAQFFYVPIKKPQEEKSHLGKWLLLHICVKDKTGREGGLAGLNEDDPLFDKLKNGLISASHKNVPASLTLNDADVAVVSDRIESFPASLENAIITKSILMYIVQGDYRLALLGICKKKDELDGDLRTATVIRDA